MATLTTDEDGKAEIGELPLGSYYLKETTAGDHFVLNPEQKEFTLSAEDDTVSVVYEGVTYKNERQKIQISVEKKIPYPKKHWRVWCLVYMPGKISKICRVRL